MSVGDRTLKAQNLPWIAAYLVVHVVVAYVSGPG